jgi:heterokaryon incompatibility protein (HET)
MEVPDTKTKQQSLVHRVTKKSKEIFSRNKKSRNSTYLEVPTSSRAPGGGLQGDQHDQILTPFESPSANSFNFSTNESDDKSSPGRADSKTTGPEEDQEQPWAVSTKENTYHYADLPSDIHFRVLELLPGKSEDRIAFSLRRVKWTEKPEYQAISYVWGDPNDVEQCIVDGQDFFITKSLYEALRNFRSEHTKLLLWADAVW